MKKKSGFKARQCPLFVVKSLGLALSLTTIVAVNGCGKKPTSTSDATTPTVVAQPVSPTTPVRAQTFEQPAVSQTPQTAATTQHAPAAPAGPDLAEINRTLIRWVVSNRRKPSSFQEFASSAGAPIPPAPAGKKYIIGANMHVQLVNQ
jgi:hypothetical protein